MHFFSDTVFKFQIQYTGGSTVYCILYTINLSVEFFPIFEKEMRFSIFLHYKLGKKKAYFSYIKF